ncbi:uncharacterized protein LOC122025048 [Zingiber officinale]|uniref:uncharacterized protein LOC122025048 n=1 Tax=Zingiber officinale TaxID=94328 RepID=UPI001C4BD479|nr:uncharacterized protein LOC122025048 [Zingiber officinale]
MVDFDRRMSSLATSHAAGLRRLSARACSAPASPSLSVSYSHRSGLLSFRPLAESILARLRAASVPVNTGLSEAEIAGIEGHLGFSFPPDLRALLSLGLPSAPGFPDWRSSHRRLRAALDLPLAAVSLQVARGALWPRAWGRRPTVPDRAMCLSRAELRRTPILIPLFDRCYLPCFPCLAGNPIFYVDEHRLFSCGLHLADFFQREPALYTASPVPLNPPPQPPPARRSLDAVPGNTPRWIEFWSDAASNHRRSHRHRRKSSFSTSSFSSSSSSCGSASPTQLDPEQFVEIQPPSRLPIWVDGYLNAVGSVLRSAGWDDSDVNEIVRVPASGMFDADDEPWEAAIDSEAALDALMVKADRCSDSLRRAGWSPDEISDALGFDFRRHWRRGERSQVKLPPEIALRAEKFAEAVAPP